MALAESVAASEVVETARGPVEYARRGEAPYVVIFHGTPGGHHASFLGEPLEMAGVGTITPSRPGYLRTPLETGRTFEEQADAGDASRPTFSPPRRRLRTCAASWTVRPSGSCGPDSTTTSHSSVPSKQLPLDRVRCPTLVVHGTDDADVPFRHGEASARRIPGAELHRVEKGWHLLALGDGAEDYARAKVAFLREHLVPRPIDTARTAPAPANTD